MTAQKPPIVVDLDGTLTFTDTLMESVARFLKESPVNILRVVLWLFSGKAAFKRQVARSFHKAGFYAAAAECSRMGVAAAGKQTQGRSPRAKQLRDTISELDSLAARAETEAKALREQEA